MIEENTDNPNVGHIPVRLAAIYVLKSEWAFFNRKISDLLARIKPLLKQGSYEKLESSFETLTSIVSDVTNSNPTLGYGEVEKPKVFKDSIRSLEDVIKDLFDAYITQENLAEVLKNSGREYTDAIDNLTNFVYKDLTRKRNNIYATYYDLYYAYPSITKVIKFIRNTVVHGMNAPSDYRARLESFHNIYTLSSILVLTFYGYAEVLEVWYDTVKHASQTKKLR